jgi:hypothetical protein
MILTKHDIEKIKQILDKFPDVEMFELDQENGSGIGSIVYMTFAHEINGLQVSVNVEVSGVEDW